ncbi:MAG: hypothetical protein WCG91_02185 [Candidatus Shapirobacteria bacterium]
MIQLSPEIFKQAKSYLIPSQDKLISDVEFLLNKLTPQDPINDYSFTVSPISKAYEGYLKDLFLKIGIISDIDYESDRFRVGKTLNPSLRYKRFSVYQKLADYHDSGEELAEVLWTAWKYGRNEIFHYFPNNVKNLTREEAEERIALVLEAIIKSGEFFHQNQKNYQY